MQQFQKLLEKYADLLVEVALNIQKGQKLRIHAMTHDVEFVRLITRKAYRQGAKKVYTQFADPVVQRIMLEEAPEEGLRSFPDWMVQMFDEIIEEGGAFLNIHSADPDQFQGIDPSRIALLQRTQASRLRLFQSAQSSGDLAWCIASVPSQNWAAKVFPDLKPEEQIDALWKEIFRTCRITVNDPVTEWQKHIEDLESRARYLNEKRFKSLHYRAPGTDLTIDLADDHLWIAASSKTKHGVRFIPNVPTEEVFTMPHKDGVNGTVRSTMPLSYSGNLIENFSLTFRDGRVVDFSADKGEEHLRSILETDEGARRLGEVALVPHQSPISQSGVIFYNTLFDENASCHIALGSALQFNLRNYEKLSEKEMKEKGFNDSIMHVDFMIGSSELDIDGETCHGKHEPIFRKGNWAF